MSFKDAVAKARKGRPEPVLVPVALGDDIFHVEVRRLDGMEWAGVTAECLPQDARGARLGYDTNEAAVLACRKHGRLLDGDGEPVDMAVVRDEHGVIASDPWDDLFTAISGVEVGAVAATWWALNMHDPNEHVVALKKALAGGSKTSSN